MNVYTGDAEEREMRTGRHTVRDVFCRVCHSVLGWKYVSPLYDTVQEMGGISRINLVDRASESSLIK